MNTCLKRFIYWHIWGRLDWVALVYMRHHIWWHTLCRMLIYIPNYLPLVRLINSITSFFFKSVWLFFVFMNQCWESDLCMISPSRTLLLVLPVDSTSLSPPVATLQPQRASWNRDPTEVQIHSRSRVWITVLYVFPPPPPCFLYAKICYFIFPLNSPVHCYI